MKTLNAVKFLKFLKILGSWNALANPTHNVGGGGCNPLIPGSYAPAVVRNEANKLVNVDPKYRR